MRKRNLFVILVFISCLVMFSAAASTARTQSKGLTGSAQDFKRAQFISLPPTSTISTSP